MLYSEIGLRSRLCTVASDSVVDVQVRVNMVNLLASIVLQLWFIIMYDVL